jgi:uroporphyrinogen-III decarboxylase
MGDTAEVEKDALHCLRKAGTDRFILMPGCGIPPNAPTENLKAMVKAAEDFGL